MPLYLGVMSGTSLDGLDIALIAQEHNTRLLGTFARLNRRDGKPQYLKHQPRIWTYLERSLAHPALTTFRCG